MRPSLGLLAQGRCAGILSTLTSTPVTKPVAAAAAENGVSSSAPQRMGISISTRTSAAALPLRGGDGSGDDGGDGSGLFLTPAQVAAYWRDGFLVLENFVPQDVCAGMRDEALRILDAFDAEREPVWTFSTVNQVSSDYFLTSGDKIRYFFESDAVDADTGELTLPVPEATNKLGHALHWLSPVFREVTFEARIGGILRSLGYTDPAVAQSMYIFKQPRIGGVVVPHQDTAFVHTAPHTTLGFWIPLQDCTTRNGCLRVAPGSHREGLLNERRMVRAPDTDRGTDFTAEEPVWDEDALVPVETPAGSLVLIHGEVVHASSHNNSGDSRHAYTWHCIERSGAVYDDRNWLQPSNELPFPGVYDNVAKEVV